MLNFLQIHGFKCSNEASKYTAIINGLAITFTLCDATDMSMNRFHIKGDNCVLNLMDVNWEQVVTIIQAIAPDKK